MVEIPDAVCNLKHTATAFTFCHVFKPSLQYTEKRVPNGKIGDEPLTDIIEYGRSLYSWRIRRLIKQVYRLADIGQRSRLANMLNGEFHHAKNPDLKKLKNELKEMRQDLVAQKKHK